jgi:hypothetical protein
VALLATDTHCHHLFEEATHPCSGFCGHAFFNGLWTHINPLELHRLLPIRGGGLRLIEKTKDQRLREA